MSSTFVGSLPVNYQDPNLYEHLSLIIDEFEKAALRSGSRQGMLATSQATLQGMDMMLAGSSRALDVGRTSSATRLNSDSGSSSSRSGEYDSEDDSSWVSSHAELGQVQESSTGSISADGFFDGELGNADIEIQPPSFVTNSASIGFDADFNELLGGEGDPNKKGDTVGDYLSECLGCDLRLQFDWQLQPIDLLGPIGNLINDINSLLDQFEGFIDPFEYLKDLCDLLNGVNFLCIPDLMMILGALKMLLKSYLTFQLNIRLDWTVILGPILKLILDALVTLLQQIAGIMVAPLDCAISALATVGDGWNELLATANVAAAVGNRVVDINETLSTGDAFEELEIESNAIAKEASFGTQELDAQNDQFDVELPVLNVQENVGQGYGDEEGEASGLPTGYEFNLETTLPQAMQDPNFQFANPFHKLATAVREARNYITDLIRKIMYSYQSLQQLTAGSMGISLGNMGMLLFLKDMINLVVLIIKMLSQHKGVSDWCEYLEENPELLERELNGTSGNMRVVPSSESLKLVHGSEVVGEIKTCFNDRSDAQSALLKRWIADLKRGGSN